MRDTFATDFVEIVLEFENYWIFEAVHIYTNNYFSRDVQVKQFYPIDRVTCAFTSNLFKTSLF